jgi:putative oxidoreductase
VKSPASAGLFLLNKERFVSSFFPIAQRWKTAILPPSIMWGIIMSNSAIVLIGRILLSIIFILAGFGKLTAIAGTAQYFASFNLPAPTAVAVLAGLVELIAGLAILVGFQTRIAAYLLALFCIASALVAHMDWADAMQLINFQKNLAMAGGLIVLAAYGPGALSVDGRRA